MCSCIKYVQHERNKLCMQGLSCMHTCKHVITSALPITNTLVHALLLVSIFPAIINMFICSIKVF